VTENEAVEIACTGPTALTTTQLRDACLKSKLGITWAWVLWAGLKSCGSKIQWLKTKAGDWEPSDFGDSLCHSLGAKIIYPATISKG